MLLFVGGQSRKVGKTSLVAAIIRATPELRWTAVKIAGHGHLEEPGKGDTARYLEAGAARALLLNAASADFAPIVAEGGNVICESSRVASGTEPDCRLLVVDPSRQDWKESVRDFASRADALIVTAEGDPPVWLGSKPLFRVAPPAWSNAALIEFVLDRLNRARATGK